MSVSNRFPRTVCTTVSKTEVIHEFGVKYCDRICEQIGGMGGETNICAVLVAFKVVYMLRRITCSSVLSKM